MVTRRLIFIVSLCCWMSGLVAQPSDLMEYKKFLNLKELFGKGNPLKISGGLSANSIANFGNNSRQSFTWSMNGNVNINILGLVDLPFSYFFTNAGQNFSYPTPPDRFNMNPKYKWITTYLGNASMSFSNYTLSGVQFKGYGVELAPSNNFKFMGMYGVLKEAVAFDTANRNNQPGYKRIGYGAKVSYSHSIYKLELIGFAAKDLIKSTNSFKFDSLLIFPKENVVLSANIRAKPLQNVELNVEYALSAVNNNTKDVSTASKGESVVSGLMKSTASVSYYKALKMGMTFSVHKTKLGFQFERVDPGYNTFGAYYFNNDIEQIQVNMGTVLLSDKLQLNGSLGYQHDDLDGKKLGSTSRIAYTLNTNLALSKAVSFTASHSTFTTAMNIKPIFQGISLPPAIANIDTLNFAQVSQSSSVGVSFRTAASKNVTHTFSVQTTIQSASKIQNNVEDKAVQSNITTVSCNYSLGLVPSKTTLTLSLLANQNTTAGASQNSFGPGVTLQKSIAKKIESRTSYFASFTKGQRSNAIQSTLTYTLFKKHNLNLNVNWQTSSTASTSSVTYTTASMGYSYRF